MNTCWFYKTLIRVCTWFISITLLSASTWAQSIDTIYAFNGLELKSTLGDYQDSLSILTGEEAFYQNYPSIKASLLKNIENGILEGSYQGTQALQFGNWQATSLNLVFFQDSLYKATWYFRRGAATDIGLLSKELDQEFAKHYGEPQAEEFPEFTIMVWEGEKHRLQTFKEVSSEYSIEFRDLGLSKQVEMVQAE